MKYLFFSCIQLLIATALPAQTVQGKQGKIYIVRHAEKQSGTDPLLTDAGNRRAGDLLRTLEKCRIQRIYVTPYQRTQHTADSLRLLLHIDTIVVKADTGCVDLFEAITRNGDWNKPILIISHSNIIPAIIYKLGITEFPQEYLPENEFDNLYLVTVKHKRPILIHKKYGQPSAASAPMQR